MGGGSIRKPASGLALVGCVVAGITLLLRPGVSAEPRASNLEALGARYASEVRPLVAQYCHKCHSAERTEADLDLTAFVTLSDVRKDARAWQRVREMIDGGQMPPRGAKQPSS
ncbi:MAG: c-type cytochrome domain-containing protein, partial [Singulisphaera sp.]